MEDNITFTIQNPDAVPANSADLFIWQDSTLVFVFTIPTSLGITELDNGDLFTIIIPKTLLASADSSNLVDTNWKVQSLTQPSSKDPNFTFVLTPVSAIEVNGTVSITFKKLQGLSLTNDEVSTLYLIQDTQISGSTEKLFVVNPPTQAKDLRDDVQFTVLINAQQQMATVPDDRIFISSKSLSPPIANRVHVNLSFNGDSFLVPSWPSSKPPKFLFSFSYGINFNDLTDAIQKGQPGYNALTSAWSIKTSINNKENNLWVLEKLDTSNDTPIWVVEPASGNSNIFKHNEGLDLVFDQIITVLPEGGAHAYVQWANIPGYNDGATALYLNKKLPEQAILSFTSPDDGITIDPNTPATLNWQAFAAENLKLTWDDGYNFRMLNAFDTQNPQLIYSGSDNTIIPDSQNTDFFLNANFDANGNGGVKAGPVQITVRDFPAPTIVSFLGGLVKDNSGNFFVTLSWLVYNLGDNGHFVLNGETIDGVGYNGLPYYHKPFIPVNPATPLEDTFTLTAVDEANSLTATQTIQATIPDWYAPIITGSGAITRDGNGNPTLTLHWKLQQVAIGSVCHINGIPQTLNADGTVNASIAITTQNPLLSTYTLTVQNPGGNPVSKTLTVNFEAKGQVPNQTPDPALSLRDIRLMPNSSNCLALYTAETNLLQLALFDAFRAGPLELSAQYDYVNPGNDYNTGLQASLSISPDGSQIYVNGTGAWFCVPLEGDFGQLLGPLPSDNQNHPIKSAVLKDMSLIFAAMEQEVVYFEPTPYAYPSPPDNNPISLPNYGTLPLGGSNPYINALCVSLDGKRVFVGSGNDGLVYFFDADNINANKFFGDCYLVQDITIAPNGWLYLVSCENNSAKRCRVHALDTSASSYDNHPSIFVGNYHDNLRVIVSQDNSFVLVPNSPDKQLYIMAGATPTTHTPTFLQNVPLNQPFSAVITPDNSRIYVATKDGIQILEPILV